MTAGTGDHGGVFKVEWRARSEAGPEFEDVVRITLNEGSWLAEPIHQGTRTRLTYTLLTNPGGWIPAFVAHMSNTIAIPRLFEAVRKRAIEKVGTGS
jgi:hypothetical protein